MVLVVSVRTSTVYQPYNSRTLPRAMASPPAAAVPEISEQLLAALSGLADDSFDRLLRCAIDNTFQFPQDGASVAIPLTISSSFTR